MLTNYHTHTCFCDGKNTPEEIVKSAIDKGFKSIGFSGHGYTPYDLSYCMKDIDGYINEISRLKEKYATKINVYCGVEEDAFSYVERERFDYIIGSSHYFKIGNEYCAIDSGCDYFKECLIKFGGDILKLAENYYEAFVGYIKARKPDIVGHFDLITKFDELDEPILLNNKEYIKMACGYINSAAQEDVIFEVNTGAIARGYRKSPYPSEELLYELKKCDAKLILSSDSHSRDTLDFYFKEATKFLSDIGFSAVYEFDGGTFLKRTI